MAQRLTMALSPNAAGSAMTPSWLSDRRILVIAASALFGLRLFMAGSLGLTEDEAYYRLWSLAPSLSFLDHPPMVAWLIAAGRAIAGEGETGVRLMAPILLAFGTALQWFTASTLVDRRVAYLATVLFLSLPLLNVGGVIITPDLPSVLFYGLVVLGLAELDKTQNAKWWLAVGVFAGCGLLSKYTNLFAGCTILIWLLAVPANRKWFASPQLWLGGLIALLISSPVVMWNANHGWASFVKQFGRVADHGGSGLFYLGEMTGGLFILLGPVTAVLAMRGLFLACRLDAQDRGSKTVLIAASILPLLGYFAFHALHGRVQANWLSPIYPMLALCAAIAINAMAPKSRMLLTCAASGTGLAITCVIYLQALTPLVTLRKDATAQMRGWSEFRKSVAALAEANEAGWVAASHYGTVGELSFALKRTLPASQLNEHIRHQHLPPLPKENIARPALYVELDRRSSEDLLSQCFSSFRRIATIVRADGTISGTPYAVYRADGFKTGCAGESTLPAAASIQTE